MRKALRTIYSRLLLTPRIGPLFRVPVLFWRAVFGGGNGLGMKSSPRDDALALTIAAIDGLRQDVDVMRRALTQHVERTDAVASGLRDRVEFVRAETMFELRAKIPSGIMPTVPGRAYPAVSTSRVIATAKVDAQRAANALRLNLGCGHIPLDEYVNVDMRELPGVDVVAEVASLPFEPGTVAEIRSAHLLEHFPLEHMRRVVLPHWRLMLRPGGILRATTPDAEAMLSDFAAGEMSFNDLREVTYGLQEYEGDYHFNMFSRDALTTLLHEAGFIEVSFAFQGRKNGKCRDMEIQGVRA